MSSQCSWRPTERKAGIRGTCNLAKPLCRGIRLLPGFLCRLHELLRQLKALPHVLEFLGRSPDRLSVLPKQSLRLSQPMTASFVQLCLWDRLPRELVRQRRGDLILIEAAYFADE